MKQLEFFLDSLRTKGYNVTTNWQQNLDRGYIESVTLHGKIGVTTVIFHVYPDNNGYNMFIQSNSNTYESDLNIIKGMVD